jgi:hypothetical protein
VEHLKKFIRTLAGLTHENLHTLEEFAGYTTIQPSEYLDLVYKVRPTMTIVSAAFSRPDR